MLEMYLENPRSPAIKNVILLSMAMGLDNEFILDLISHYDEYHDKWLVKVTSLGELDLEAFNHVINDLSSELKRKLDQNFLNGLLQQTTVDDKFDYYLDFFTHYADIIEALLLQRSEIVAIQAQVRALATQLGIHEPIDIEKIFENEWSTAFIEKLKKDLAAIKYAYQLRELLHLPLGTMDYMQWAQHTIDQAVEDKNVRWHMKKDLVTDAHLKELISPESQPFQDLKSKAVKWAESEAEQLRKLEHQRSLTLRFDHKISGDTLLSRIAELKKETKWQEQDLTRDKIEKVSAQLAALKKTLDFFNA